MELFNTKQLITKISLAAILLVTAQSVLAQTFYTLAQNTGAEIKVLGKSNTDALILPTTAMDSRGEFKFDGENLDDITSLSFNLSTENLISKKSIINKRVYKALYTTNNPVIRFDVKCATVTPTLSDNKYGIILGGELTVGDVTQLKCMLLNATMNADSTITLTGHTNVQLTNDNLKSIKFMEGPVQIDNDLAIQFSFTYKKDVIQDMPIDTPYNRMQDYITKL